MKTIVAACAGLALLLLGGCMSARPVAAHQPPVGEPEHGRARPPVWRGLHLLINGDADIVTLQAQLPRLAAAGVNTLILEVGYNFVFSSHPELSPATGVTAARAHRLAAAARQAGIRLIPELDCLGHQSWSKTTMALLAKHPEFDETPGAFPDNAGIYCRSWCPQHPGVNAVVFALIDELVQAFEADAFHVGMDEVFLVASDLCPRCHGGDPARLFARAVNDLHRHIVGEHHLEMLMWGDRLLDAATLNGGEWEYAKNGTAGAIDLIPTDIVICDWHYEKHTTYPSVPLLLAKGFRVWPSSWQPLENAQAFSAFCRRQPDGNVVGFLCTVWGKTTMEHVADWPPLVETLAGWK